jgi:Flp pilus assembly protein TadG
MNLRAISFVTSRLPRAINRLIGDRRAVSAVEFALLAPVMIGLYLGCVEISEAVGADRKVSLTAAALANLAAQVPTISSSDMTNILDAAGQIITPYKSSLLQSTVSCLKMDSTGKATVQWSATRNGTALSNGSVYTFSSSNAALAVPNTSLILAVVSYAYTPVVGYTITGTLTLSDQMFMSPRISAPTYTDSGNVARSCS